MYQNKRKLVTEGKQLVDKRYYVCTTTDSKLLQLERY